MAGLFSPGNYVLPVVALALYPTAVITRLVSRACEIEMQKDYVIMARCQRPYGEKDSSFTYPAPCFDSGTELSWDDGSIFNDGKLCSREYLYDSGAGERICQFHF